MCQYDGRHERERTDAFQDISVIFITQIDIADVHSVVDIVEADSDGGQSPCVAERKGDIHIKVMDVGHLIIISVLVCGYRKR